MQRFANNQPIEFIRFLNRTLVGENNEVAVGDGWAMAWRVSARLRRWREAPSR